VSHFRDNKTRKGASERLTNFWRHSSTDLSEEVGFWIHWWNKEHKDHHLYAASFEAPRRYYSSKYLLQNGADKIFPKPNIMQTRSSLIITPLSLTTYGYARTKNP
jgi:hypothetical protein